MKLTIALFACALLAKADETTKAAKVEEFFRLTKMDKSSKQALELMANQMKSGLIQQAMGVKVDPAQQARTEKFQQRLNQVILEAVAWDKIKPGYIKLYGDAYSEAELDDILAFYRSPTGLAMVARGPGLMAESFKFVQQRMVELGPELRKAMDEFIKQSQ